MTGYEELEEKLGSHLTFLCQKFFTESQFEVLAGLVVDGKWNRYTFPFRGIDNIRHFRIFTNAGHLVDYNPYTKIQDQFYLGPFYMYMKDLFIANHVNYNKYFPTLNEDTRREPNGISKFVFKKIDD